MTENEVEVKSRKEPVNCVSILVFFSLNYKFMSNVITPKDLEKFKKELLKDIKRLLTHQVGRKGSGYFKSAEVMKLLKVSAGTLQNLRQNGTLPYAKVGGTIYYHYDDIENLMEKSRIHHRGKKT